MTHIRLIGAASAICGEVSPEKSLPPGFVKTISLRSLCPNCAVEWIRKEIQTWSRFEELGAVQADPASHPDAISRNPG